LPPRSPASPNGRAGKSREARTLEKNLKLKVLVGSGDKIGLFVLPFLAVGLILNILFPSFFSAAGPPTVLRMISIILLIPGLTIWIWSVVLILKKAPKKELITNGPYSLVKHPIYIGVALLVLPWVGFLYVGSRLFSSEEEDILLKAFGPAWEEYSQKVKLPWL
jgi:protein-S-isoprenylcysteine O-methyltransferase Ste14